MLITTETIEPIVRISSRAKARMAGALYFFSLVTAASTELFVHGSLNLAVSLAAVLGMACMTLLLYELFRPVNRGLSIVASVGNLAGLTFEALRWNPQGIDTIAGLAWITYVSPKFAEQLAPYNAATALLGEGCVMLWLLSRRVNLQRWNHQSTPGLRVG